MNLYRFTYRGSDGKYTYQVRKEMLNDICAISCHLKTGAISVEKYNDYEAHYDNLYGCEYDVEKTVKVLSSMLDLSNFFADDMIEAMSVAIIELIANNGGNKNVTIKLNQ